MSRTTISIASSIALAITVASSAQSLVTGPSSSATPYVRAHNGYPVDIHSILTVGDFVNFKPDGISPYRFCGIPDGMGAYLNNDGTMTVLVTHEYATNNGGSVPRAHHPAGFSNGAFTSQW